MESPMKRYSIKTRFVLEGSFYAIAGNKEKAREYVEKHCGLVLGRDIHSSLYTDAVNWEFPMHPEKLIGRITLAKKNE